MIQIQVNGMITFGYATDDYTTDSSPLGVNRVSVYWADVFNVCGGSRITGDVYYRVSTGELTSIKHGRRVVLITVMLGSRLTHGP